MDRTDICLECRQPIRWARRKSQRTAPSAWALFTGECACTSHTAVRPNEAPRPQAA